MDWKFKHFRHAAIFSATPQSVLEAARLVTAESFGVPENTSDGFVARGRSGWHAATATFHVTAAPDGTELAVELQVQRWGYGGYMLFDIGGFYDGRIDRWFSAVAQRLGRDQEKVLISKTTAGVRTRRGCMAGCLVWLLVTACLGTVAFPLDRALFPQSAGTTPGPFSYLASLLSLLAGIAVFLYVTNPEAPAAKFIRERLQRTREKDEK